MSPLQLLIAFAVVGIALAALGAAAVANLVLAIRSGHANATHMELIEQQVQDIHSMADGRLTALTDELKLSVTQVAALRTVIAAMAAERKERAAVSEATRET